MKLLVMASLIALSFATGFTCSKNKPEEIKNEETPAATSEQAPAGSAPVEQQPSQEQMAQPVESNLPAEPTAPAVKSPEPQQTPESK